MIAAIGRFLAPWAGKLLGWGAIALGVLLVLLRVKRAGRVEAENEARERTIDNVEKANVARREVRDAHARGDVPPRVRKFYVPDE